MQDLWEWRPSGAPCSRKHVWVYYHTFRIRECVDCGAREDLWADFGLTKVVDDEEGGEHSPGQ